MKINKWFSAISAYYAVVALIIACLYKTITVDVLALCNLGKTSVSIIEMELELNLFNLGAIYGSLLTLNCCMCVFFISLHYRDRRKLVKGV